jgi:photosynthetic reaction center cytochrome c subunit
MPGSRLTAGLAAMCGVWLLGVALAASQAPQAKPLMSEEFFKNVQVLKGIPVDEFLDTMGMFSAATGLNCTDCHIPESGGSWARYADDSPLKRTTRRMMAMVDNINASNFGGRRVLTCYSCHNGNRRPNAIPSLAAQYAVDPIIEDPYEILQAPGAPSADTVLDKYIEAVGGAVRLTSFTSVVAKGTYRGFDDSETYPLEIFAKAPNQRTTILHSQYGDMTTTYDGRSGWLAAPAETKPAPVMALTGGNLEGAGVDAELSFPGHIKQVLRGWVAGPLTLIDDREVRIVQGKKANGSPIKLYFEEASGLLVRLVRYSDSPVGRVPTQIDYEDYRDVSGIKIPFKWTSTWTDGRTVFELSSVEVNARIDATSFAKPTAPASAAIR